MSVGAILAIGLYVLAYHTKAEQAARVTEVLFSAEQSGEPITDGAPLITRGLKLAREEYGPVESFWIKSTGYDLGLTTWHCTLSVRRRAGLFEETVVGGPEPRLYSITRPGSVQSLLRWH